MLARVMIAAFALMLSTCFDDCNIITIKLSRTAAPTDLRANVVHYHDGHLVEDGASVEATGDPCTCADDDCLRAWGEANLACDTAVSLRCGAAPVTLHATCQ